MNIMRTYIENLSDREKQVLLFATPGIVLLILWLTLISPTIEKNQHLNKALVNKSEDYQWMLNSQHLVPQQSDQNTPSLDTNKSIRQLVNDIFNQSNLSMKRLNGISEEKVSITINEAEFNKVITAIGHLENKGVRLTKAQFLPSERSGIVSAELVFEGATP